MLAKGAFGNKAHQQITKRSLCTCIYRWHTNRVINVYSMTTDKHSASPLIISSDFRCCDLELIRCDRNLRYKQTHTRLEIVDRWSTTIPPRPTPPATPLRPQKYERPAWSWPLTYWPGNGTWHIIAPYGRTKKEENSLCLGYKIQ